ncbi:sphingomyelin phosphodiesterase-like [Dysidea avara]|uniref:sphingomyelin phosphodiesterase-like n=1 Tax=Dysidea avara TaxID=196820 RepID=UPI0033326C87
MAYTKLVLNLLALWTVLQCTAILISDKCDVDRLYKELQDPSKDRIDVECDACVLIVCTIQALARENRTEEEIVTTATYLCEKLTERGKLVCSGIVPEFRNEVLYVFTSIALGPKEVCGALIGDGCGHYYNPWTQNWTVTFPDKPKPPVQPLPVPNPNGSIIRVLHLSDIHIDLQYTEGLRADCGDPLCCRPPNHPAPPGRPAGHWGDFNCDLPLWTLTSLFEHLVKIKDQFDWLYWTGDLPAHNVWNQTRSEQLEALNTVSRMMEFYLGDKKVYPTLGNHESAPVNSFPPPFITGENSNQWLLNAYQTNFSHWLPSDTASTIKKGGFYSTKLVPGLKLISLNMNYCNTENWWLLINSTDPAGQLQWLINELQESEDDGEKVHIIGHIGPGSKDCMQVWSSNYYHIVNRYEATIVGQFFGHSHYDEFELFYDLNNASRAISIAYLGPSVTPYTSNNPGYRIYELEGRQENSGFQMIDHHVYYLDLNAANNNNNLTWQYEYGAKEAYGLKTLHPQDWSSFVDKMETNDTLFNLFYKYLHRRETSTCTGSCKTIMLCLLRSGRSNETSHCANATAAHRYYFNNKSC